MSVSLAAAACGNDRFRVYVLLTMARGGGVPVGERITSSTVAVPPAYYPPSRRFEAVSAAVEQSNQLATDV